MSTSQFQPTKLTLTFIRSKPIEVPISSKFTIELTKIHDNRIKCCLSSSLSTLVHKHNTGILRLFNSRKNALIMQ